MRKRLVRSTAAAFGPFAALFACSACFDFTAYPFGEEGRYCWDDRSCNPGLFCDGSKVCVNPCKGLDCSGHGTCVVNASEGAACVCDSGFIVTDRVSCTGTTGQLGYPCNIGDTCASELICRDNVCYSDVCIPQPKFSLHCFGGNLSWYDSCGARETVARDCGGNGCLNDVCVGPTWNELRLSSSDPDISGQETELSDIALAMGGPDQIFVGWSGARGDSPTDAFGRGVFVRQWSSTAGWSFLGPQVSETTYNTFRHYDEVQLLAIHGGLLRTTRAFDTDNASHTIIGVDRWTGAAWEPEVYRPTDASPVQIPFDPQTTNMSAGAPSLAANSVGKAVLVWNEWDQDFDSDGNFDGIYVARRSNVSGWSPFNSGSTSGSGAVGYQETRSHPAKAIVTANGDVYLIWNVYVGGWRTIQIRRDSSGTWTPPSGFAGQISTANEHDGFVSAIADSQNRIFLAWTHENDSGTNQFVARLDPDGTLSEIGRGSASTGGISASILKTDAPRIALDASEFPIVVWREEGRPQAKRWDGMEWRNYGRSGATDVLGDQLPAGAVVNTMEVAIASDRLCLAWARVLSTPPSPPSLRVSCTTPQ